MKTNQRRITVALSVAAGGLLSAAFLPMAVALADDLIFTPYDDFDPTQVEGYPPLFDEVTGTQGVDVYDLTSAQYVGTNLLQGVDTETTFGSITNYDFLITTPETVLTTAIPNDTEFDLANFGGGFENEWIDIPGTGTGTGVSDLLITPFGDLPLVGTFFADFGSGI
jgi:hypothetical protein